MAKSTRSLALSLAALGLAALAPTAARTQTQDLTTTEFVAGAIPGTFGATKTLTGPSLNAVEGLAFDVRGDLFAANLYSGSFGPGTITKFIAGTTPGTFGLGMVVASGLDRPDGLAFGPSVSAPVPEASTTVSFGLLQALGVGGLVIAARKKRKAEEVLSPAQAPTLPSE